MIQKPATMTLVRTIGEPVRLSADLVLTVVSVRERHVQLKLCAPHGMLGSAPALVAGPSARLSVPLGTSLAVAERALVEATLKACKGSKRRAAVVLGCSLKGLYNKLHGYGLMHGAVTVADKTAGAKRPGRTTNPRAKEKGLAEAKP